MDTPNLLLKTPPFMIQKYVLEPNGIALAPRGHVLHLGFMDEVAYAWIQHPVNSPMDMQLMTMPTGGPFEIEIDDANFERPVHVGSFEARSGKVRVSKGVGDKTVASVWHVFVFLPKHTGSIIRPN